MIVAVSHDRGRTWNDLQVLAHRFIEYSWPKIVTEGDSVHVTYQGEIGWDKNIYVVGSDDRGMHWTDENAVPLVDMSLPYGPATSNGSLYIAITVRGANASWQPTILQTSDLGKTWDVTETDIPSDRIAFICEARISGGEIRVLTTAGYSKSSLHEFDWSIPNADIPCGTFLGSDSTLHVFRQPGALVRQSSFDDGDNWTERIVVLESTNKGIRDYGVGFENDDIVVVYSERKSADQYESQELYFVVSNNGGVTWSTPQRITDHTNELAIPLFALVVSLFVFLTLLIVWLLRELVRAHRKLPIRF